MTFMVKRFKLASDSIETFSITRLAFEKVTLEKRPYYQRRDDGKPTGHYAVCPGCNNPLQIIGLYKTLKHTSNAFGRHSPRPVDGFVHYDPLSYEACPYLLRTKSPKPNERRILSPLAGAILKIVESEFDRVVYVLRKDTGFYFSKRFAQDMLRQYLANEGYLYKGASLRNIPWVVFYISFSKNFFGQRLYQKFEKLQELRSAINEGAEYLTLSDDNVIVAGASYEAIHGFMTRHRFDQSDEGEINESIALVLHVGSEPGEKGKRGIILWEHTIDIDHLYFERLITKSESPYRDQGLLNIAREEVERHVGSNSELEAVTHK